ncbi:hypothetical protein CRG98_035083 [Punica granatum]|uniref:Cystatin domain-containing protein n=1 Tax=Punica granatum TaxID=22663 RepID=A0A2I0IKL2_PUNGR|nr:hypothetical protein CRG98_035083 [Punica granatum]
MVLAQVACLELVEILKGFDVGEFPNVFHYGLIRPISFNGDDKDLIYFTNLGIAHYNEKEVACLELVEILKVNTQPCSPYIFYITFEAEDASTATSANLLYLRAVILVIKDRRSINSPTITPVTSRFDLACS